MSTGTTVVIVVIAIIVIGAVAAVALSAARRRRLQQRFGPEYDRLVAEHDSRLKAEAELTQRERRVSKLDIRPLDPAARARYAQEWATIQEQFVDAPPGAVAQAQNLVVAVMRERGYPADDQDQLMADLSVEHAAFLDHYRAASAISEQAATGPPSTEDLRQAMIHYRSMFKDLLGEPAVSAATAAGDTAPGATAAGATAAGATAAGAVSPEGDAMIAERETVVADREAGPAGTGAVDAEREPELADTDSADVAAARARDSVADQSPAAAPAEPEPAAVEPVVDTDPVHDDLHVVTPDDGPARPAERAPADTVPDERPADPPPPADTEVVPADTEPEHASFTDSIRRRIGR